jgi:hypothetical protein
LADWICAVSWFASWTWRVWTGATRSIWIIDNHRR